VNSRLKCKSSHLSVDNCGTVDGTTLFGVLYGAGLKCRGGSTVRKRNVSGSDNSGRVAARSIVHHNFTPYFFLCKHWLNKWALLGGTGAEDSKTFRSIFLVLR
jgi:hypothetical protein